MDSSWLLMQYAVVVLRERVRAARAGDSQTGALSLEWIVIAVGLVAVAALALGLIKKAVNGEAKSLP